MSVPFLTTRYTLPAKILIRYFKQHKIQLQFISIHFLTTLHFIFFLLLLYFSTLFIILLIYTFSAGQFILQFFNLASISISLFHWQNRTKSFMQKNAWKARWFISLHFRYHTLTVITLKFNCTETICALWRQISSGNYRCANVHFLYSFNKISASRYLIRCNRRDSLISITTDANRNSRSIKLSCRRHYR